MQNTELVTEGKNLKLKRRTMAKESQESRRQRHQQMKHDAAAIECFLLMAFLTLIIYHAFLYLNLKPAIRKNKSEEYWVNLMAAEIYGDLIPSALSP